MLATQIDYLQVHWQAQKISVKFNSVYLVIVSIICRDLSYTFQDETREFTPLSDNGAVEEECLAWEDQSLSKQLNNLNDVQRG
jgi:hypothetical protein